MSARAEPRGSSVWDAPSLRAGFLAALPLFLCYELGLLLSPAGSARSSSELVLGRALFVFGERMAWARWGLLGAACALCWVHGRDSHAPGELARRLARRSAEGAVAGVFLAPLLGALLAWLGAEPSAAPEPPRSLAAVLTLLGAAPWEELLFRVATYGMLFLLVSRAAAFLGAPPAIRAYGAEWIALLGSALAFAAFHLDAVQSSVGARGEPFRSALFLWRVAAGILLAALFRWRGLGVSAWAHAVFNLGIALGVGLP